VEANIGLCKCNDVVGPIATEQNTFAATSSMSRSSLDRVLPICVLRDLMFSLGLQALRGNHIDDALIVATYKRQSDASSVKLGNVAKASDLRPLVSPNTASKLESCDKQKTARLSNGRNLHIRADLCKLLLRVSGFDVRPPRRFLPLHS
jgi:hypothetical protein